MGWFTRLAATALFAGAAGCSSVSASAIATGPIRLPPHSGGVAVYATGQPASGAEIGTVEAHATQGDATIETLVPLLLQKVATLGGNAAVIDAVTARFELVPRPMSETMLYHCAWRATCVGSRSYWITDEVLVLSVRGRAFRVPHVEAP